MAVVAVAALVLAAIWLTAERPATGPADRGAVLRSLSAPPAQDGASVDSLPTQAQGVISSALGRDDPQFATTRRDGELRLAAGGVAGTFGDGHVTFDARGERLSLGLSAIGRGDSLRSLGAVAPTAQRNRVTYRHELGVTEWYAAGPLGIEQGFTIPRSPAPGAAPLTLALPARGSLLPRVAGSEAEFVTRSGGWRCGTEG